MCIKTRNHEQVSSRVARCFDIMAKLESGFQDRIKAQLDELLSGTGLSPELKEIVTKIRG